MGAGASAGKAAPVREAFVRIAEGEEPIQIVFLVESTLVNGKAILELEAEAVILRKEDGEEIAQFPYPAILCWGKNGNIFKFKLTGDGILRKLMESSADSTTDDADVGHGERTTVSVTTRRGENAIIEANIMKRIKALMAAMESVAIPKEDFNLLVESVEAERDVSIIKQSSIGRSFTAHQAVTLVNLFIDSSPFDAVEVAKNMYDRLLNKNSFQLILNCFLDPNDRENICARLGIDPTKDRMGSISAGMLAPAAGTAGSFRRKKSSKSIAAFESGPAEKDREAGADATSSSAKSSAPSGDAGTISAMKSSSDTSRS